MEWQVVTSLDQLEPGDHLRSLRNNGPIPYYHHGIYVSPEEVIGEMGSANASIRNPFVRGGGVIKQDINKFGTNGKSTYSVEKRIYSPKELLYKNSPEKTIAIARAMLGIRNYDLLSNNCESFANICTFGKPVSSQVNRFLGAVAGGSAGIAASMSLTRSIENGGIRIPIIIASALGGARAGARLADTYSSNQFYENESSMLRANKFWEGTEYEDNILPSYRTLQTR